MTCHFDICIHKSVFKLRIVRVAYDIHVINLIIEFVRYKNVHEIVLIYFERIFSRQFESFFWKKALSYKRQTPEGKTKLFQKYLLTYLSLNIRK